MDGVALEDSQSCYRGFSALPSPFSKLSPFPVAARPVHLHPPFSETTGSRGRVNLPHMTVALGRPLLAGTTVGPKVLV